MKPLWVVIALGSLLLCGVMGYLIANRQPLRPISEPDGGVLGPGVKDTSDMIDQLLRVDPKLIICRESARFPTKLKELRGLAVGPEDRIYAVGDQALVILDRAGKELSRSDLGLPGLAVGAGSDGSAFVAFRDHVSVTDAQGQKKADWESLGPKAWLTSVAVTEAEVLVADFGEKRIVRYDRSGKLQNQWGPPGSGKFEVPSPYFDVAVDPTGQPWVAHTGRRVLERYKPDGTLVSSWGKSTPKIEGFSGCCNPSHFAFRKDGSFVTAEKGLVRVKIHGPTGEFIGVVAAAKDFEKNIHGLDVAVDSKDRILVLDPGTGSIRVYEMKAPESKP